MAKRKKWRTLAEIGRDMPLPTEAELAALEALADEDRTECVSEPGKSGLDRTRRRMAGDKNAMN